MDIPDAPWIRETERTGHYRYGWWNQPVPDYDYYEEGDDYLEQNPLKEDDESELSRSV